MEPKKIRIDTSDPKWDGYTHADIIGEIQQLLPCMPGEDLREYVIEGSLRGIKINGMVMI